MKNKNQFRQGDVLIVKTKSIPPAAVRQSGRVILAHGEVTGHCHELSTDASEAWKSGDELTVKVKKAAPVTHQEHAPIPLKRGAYRVVRQKEYAPEAIRNMAD